MLDYTVNIIIYGNRPSKIYFNILATTTNIWKDSDPLAHDKPNKTASVAN